MMMWTIGILSAFLILDCLFLMLLVLIQLPKKDAGSGLGFGAGATDALFGAGSGNALTKLTKYATAVFFVLTLGLSILNAHQARSKKSNLERTLQSVKDASPLPAPAKVPAVTNPPAAAADTNKPAASTNTPPATAPTNAPGLLSVPPAAEKGK